MTGEGSASGRDPTLADLGLVALVGGSAVSLALGIVTIGVGALLGRIPSFLAAVLALSLLVTMAGLAVTIVVAGNRKPGNNSPTPAEETREDERGSATGTEDQ